MAHPKQSTIDFFNSKAGDWDSYTTDKDLKDIRSICSRIPFAESDSVLDVGCGTGILVPFLLERGVDVENITAMDVSAEMIEILRRKHGGVRAVCGDFEEHGFSLSAFDKVIIYNAFPHFSDPARVICNAFSCLKSPGLFVVAHSMNRRDLDAFHAGVEGAVSSHRLISDGEFEALLRAAGFGDVAIEDANSFYLEAVK